MSDKPTYVVCQEAIYMHGVFGPFETLDEAIAFADECTKHPCEDGHHDYVVRTLPAVNEPSVGVLYTTSAGREYRWGCARGHDAVARLYPRERACGARECPFREVPNETK